MSARYSAASAASTSGSNEPVCEFCGSASRTTTAGESLPGIGPESRAIPMCAPLWPTPRAQDAKHGAATDYELSGVRDHNMLLHMAVGYQMRGQCPCRCHTSTSSAAVSPARTSPTPAAEQGSTGNGRVFGGNSLGSLGNFDPATCSLRTCQLSLLGDSTESLRTLPRAGSMRNGIVYQHRPSAPLTGGTGSGSWPTPTARDHKDTGDLSRVPENGLLPRAVYWATPTAWLGRRPSQATGDPERWHNPERSNELSDQVAASGTTGSLNPTFVEFLMGFPKDWTEV